MNIEECSTIMKCLLVVKHSSFQGLQSRNYNTCAVLERKCSWLPLICHILDPLTLTFFSTYQSIMYSPTAFQCTASDYSEWFSCVTGEHELFPVYSNSPVLYGEAVPYIGAANVSAIPHTVPFVAVITNCITCDSRSSLPYVLRNSDSDCSEKWQKSLKNHMSWKMHYRKESCRLWSRNSVWTAVCIFAPADREVWQRIHLFVYFFVGLKWNC